MPPADSPAPVLSVEGLCKSYGALKAVDVGGKPYREAFVCKPQDCGDRKFEVMFDADATHAYGALGGRNDPPAFYGAPPPEVQDALAKGFQG